VAKIGPTLKELKDNFNSGRTRDADWRKGQLRQLMAGIEKMSEQMKLAMLKDLGRSEFQTKIYELDGVITHCEHHLKNLDDYMADEYHDPSLIFAPSIAKIQWEPLGIVLVMGSWNYPYYVVLKPLAQAIATGNGAILKPSELAPESSKMIAKLVEDFLDTRFFRVMEGDVSVSIAISKHPFNLICFTGSTEKGRLVQKAAAENLIPCILELGGKCPMIVSDSSDADFAAFKLASMKYANAG
jgi:aldehyde dehydrogenase (NAD+)